MLQSFIEQKWAPVIFGSKDKLPDNLTAHQWTLQEKILSVPALFEELTRKASSSDALASDMIPAITMLLGLLTKINRRGIKTMKGTFAACCQETLH